MILKCQVNTDTNKNRYLLSTICLERVMKYSYLVSIIEFFLCLSVFQSFRVKLTFYQLKLYQHQLAHTLIALAHTLIALALLNSTEKMHRLCTVIFVLKGGSLQCMNQSIMKEKMEKIEKMKISTKKLNPLKFGTRENIRYRPVFYGF